MDALSITLATTLTVWLSTLAAADARRTRQERARRAACPPPIPWDRVDPLDDDGHRFGRAGVCGCGVTAEYYHFELVRAGLPCPLAPPPGVR